MQAVSAPLYEVCRIFPELFSHVGRNVVLQPFSVWRQQFRGNSWAEHFINIAFSVRVVEVVFQHLGGRISQVLLRYGFQKHDGPFRHTFPGGVCQKIRNGLVVASCPYKQRTCFFWVKLETRGKCFCLFLGEECGSVGCSDGIFFNHPLRVARPLFFRDGRNGGFFGRWNNFHLHVSDVVVFPVGQCNGNAAVRAE